MNIMIGDEVITIVVWHPATLRITRLHKRHVATWSNVSSNFDEHANASSNIRTKFISHLIIVQNLVSDTVHIPCRYRRHLEKYPVYLRKAKRAHVHHVFLIHTDCSGKSMVVRLPVEYASHSSS